MAKPNKANSGPGIKATAPKTSPGAKAGINVATKTNGKFGGKGMK